MRLPCCSISLWSDLIYEISAPPCVRQKCYSQGAVSPLGWGESARRAPRHSEVGYNHRSRDFKQDQKILPVHTRAWRPSFETLMKLFYGILGSKWRRFAWQIPKAQGLGLSGN